MKNIKNILVYVNSLPASTVKSIHEYSKETDKDFRILLIRDTKAKSKAIDNGADILIDVDFSRPIRLAESILPYQDQLLAVTCRSESNIARFIKVIPHVPYLRTPSTESLFWSTDKYEMRKRLNLFDPKHTPRFTWIKNNSKKERVRVIEKIKFPLIVKPASLAGSSLVSICYHEEEFEKTLRTAFRKIKKEYRNDNRIEEPKLLAEEYMEGEMYSIDSYVNSRGQVYHCPPVRVTTGKNIGHDDFYNYLRVTPTGLKKESIETAQDRVELGIQALGLRSTTVHAELLRVDGDWKFIEIGPRIGGFRHSLHQLSCDINHGLNDILIRIPVKPVIPKKCKGFAAAMRYYASGEGVITQISGVKKIKELASYKDMMIKAKIGDKAFFAKNGGNGIFDLTLFNEDRAKLLADIRRVEQMVEVKVGRGNGGSKKVVAKKSVVKKSIDAGKAASKKVVKGSTKTVAKKVSKKK